MSYQDFLGDAICTVFVCFVAVLAFVLAGALISWMKRGYK